MEALQRRATTTLLFGFAVVLGCLFCSIVLLSDSSSNKQAILTAGIAICALICLHILHWRYTPLVTVLIIDVLAAWYLPIDEQYIVVAVPAVVAFVLTDMRWLLISAIGVYGGLLMRSGFSGPYMHVGTFAAYCLIIGSLCIGRQNFHAAQALAETSTRLAALRTTMFCLLERAGDKITAAFGHLDLFLASAPSVAFNRDLYLARTELEDLVVVMRELNEASFQSDVLANAPLSESQHT